MYKGDWKKIDDIMMKKIIRLLLLLGVINLKMKAFCFMEQRRWLFSLQQNCELR